jgi:chaperonin GroES
MELDFKADLSELMSSPNIAEMMDETQLDTIGHRVVLEYEMDRQSRQEWEKRMEDSMKLALQVVEQKSFPWPNASNVKFPLITIAALQFHARAYPALIPGKDIVKCRVNTVDPDGMKTLRAQRIEEHMSYQLLEQDEEWEDQMDKVLISTPIIGCSFKKTYFSQRIKGNKSDMVLARDLVVDYWTKSLETATRITHVLYMNNNDLHERIARGLYREVDLQRPQAKDPHPGLDKQQGIYPSNEDPQIPYEVLEQHRYIDLDGDGYAEPYIVTVAKDSKKVLRILANFYEGNIERVNGTIAYISPEQYFTKFSFIPSPDGGFYDLGFGVLLGPLNESINTLVNQLIDAGTMSVTAGGFLGRGLKIRGGNQSFAPLEWKHVETTGDDIRKNVFPLPVREPSQVLFTLLSLLINYGERIGSATEIMVGENPGQNTPAETSRNMVEQGMKIFTGIFKRVHRSLKQELRKHYRLNQLYLDKQVTFGSKKVLAEDYAGPIEDITPTADPNVVSDSQRLMQAQAVLQAAHGSPGYNLYEANKRYLQALKVQAIDVLLPDPAGPNAVPPPQNPKVEIEKMKLQSKQAEMQLNAKLAGLELMQKAELIEAQVTKLQAEAAKLLAEADGVDTGHQIALLNAQIGAQKAHKDSLIKAAQTMLKAVEVDREGVMNEASGDASRVSGLVKPSSNEGAAQGTPQQ